MKAEELAKILKAELDDITEMGIKTLSPGSKIQIALLQHILEFNALNTQYLAAILDVLKPPTKIEPLPDPTKEQAAP